MSDHQAAASVEEREALGFKAWPNSGSQLHRVAYKADGRTRYIEVDATTGDEAALKARVELGEDCKITSIFPAPKADRPTLKVKAD